MAAVANGLLSKTEFNDLLRHPSARPYYLWWIDKNGYKMPSESLIRKVNLPPGNRRRGTVLMKQLTEIFQSVYKRRLVSEVALARAAAYAVKFKAKLPAGFDVNAQHLDFLVFRYLREHVHGNGTITPTSSMTGALEDFAVSFTLARPIVFTQFGQPVLNWENVVNLLYLAPLATLDCMFLEAPENLDDFTHEDALVIPGAEPVCGDIPDEDELASIADLYYTGEPRYTAKLPWHQVMAELFGPKHTIPFPTQDTPVPLLTKKYRMSIINTAKYVRMLNKCRPVLQQGIVVTLLICMYAYAEHGDQPSFDRIEAKLNQLLDSGDLAYDDTMVTD